MSWILNIWKLLWRDFSPLSQVQNLYGSSSRKWHTSLFLELKCYVYVYSRCNIDLLKSVCSLSCGGKLKVRNSRREAQLSYSRQVCLSFYNVLKNSSLPGYIYIAYFSTHFCVLHLCLFHLAHFPWTLGSFLPLYSLQWNRDQRLWD